MSTTRMKTKNAQKSEQNKKIAHHKDCDTRVFFIDGKLLSEPCEDVEIISLRNPSTENSSRYLYAKHLMKFYEILSFTEEPRSWFINDLACSDGNLYMTSAFDPLFWGLYYIRLNCMDRCQPIDQTLVDENFANTHLIADALTVEQLSMIGDQKGDKSLKAFKYNEAKALKWLSIKCNNLADALKEKKFHIGAKSAYFIKAEKFDSAAQNVDSELLSYAFGIVCEYVTSDLSDKLSEYLGLEKVKPTVAGKRKSIMEPEHRALKRLKSEEADIEDIKPFVAAVAVKEKKVSTKEKQLAKAASGTKSISAFFTKK